MYGMANFSLNNSQRHNCPKCFKWWFCSMPNCKFTTDALCVQCTLKMHNHKLPDCSFRYFSDYNGVEFLINNVVVYSANFEFLEQMKRQ